MAEGLVTISTKKRSLTIHATTSVVHTKTSDITQFPAERGVNFSDHIRPKPDKVTIEGWISDHEMSGKPGDSRAAYDFFEELHKNPELVTIQTVLDSYEDMALANVPIPEKPDFDEALTFTAEFQLFVVTDEETVTLEAKQGAKRTKPPVEQNFQKVAPDVSIASRRLNLSSDQVKQMTNNALQAAGKAFDGSFKPR